MRRRRPGLAIQGKCASSRSHGTFIRIRPLRFAVQTKFRHVMLRRTNSTHHLRGEHDRSRHQIRCRTRRSSVARRDVALVARLFRRRLKQHGDVVTPVRANYQGVLVGNMGYTPDEANAAVQEGKLDAVAFGTDFLANPDLPARIKAKASRNAPNPATFYSSGPEGYTDYPTLAA